MCAQPDQGKGAVDEQDQHSTCHRGDGALLLHAFLDTEGLHVQCDYRGEDESCDRIHRLIAFKETLLEGMGCILPLPQAGGCCGQRADSEDRNQYDKGGREALSQSVRQPLGPAGEQGRKKEEERTIGEGRHS